jgi:hypothetical protein
LTKHASILLVQQRVSQTSLVMGHLLLVHPIVIKVCSEGLVHLLKEDLNPLLFLCVLPDNMLKLGLALLEVVLQ